jgi:LmbE family N-acetylglucosaminyl deacetylase
MPLTIMAVHAHPDDESSSTGGVLARYSAEGVRTVVVTCTNGELGDGPGGVKPGEDGHAPDAVVEIRRDELERACATLGVTHLELLGYRDSGMAGWSFKDHPDAFAAADLVEAAERLSALFRLYVSDVVITYEDDGLYDHPDHVQASRVTMAALERTGIPKKAYFATIRGSSFARLRETMREQGIEMPDFPDPDEAFQERMRTLEARITTTVDVSSFLEQKRAALAQHASQMDESFFSRLPPQAFDIVFAQEDFIRVHDSTGAPLPEDDLLAGLRDS